MMENGKSKKEKQKQLEINTIKKEGNITPRPATMKMKNKTQKSC